MSAVSARPERLVTTTPSVARQDSQDGVVLSLAGEWIVSAGHQLEAAGASLISLAKDAKRVILDLAGLQRMDTAGAWFIDRARGRTGGARSDGFLSRRAAQARPPAQGGWLPSRPRSPRAFLRPHTVALLSAIGETVYESGVDFFDIRRLSRRSRCDVLAPRPAAVALALDSDGASPRDVRAAQRADHHADQLSGRRDRHPAGHLPARQIRRRRLTPSTWLASWVCASSAC